MEINIYNVIKGPWVTAKAYSLNQTLKQLVLEVHPFANKPMIAEALKKLFNVEVDCIRLLVVKGKKRRAMRRHIVESKTRKKALITLRPGSSLELGELPVNPV